MHALPRWDLTKLLYVMGLDHLCHQCDADFCTEADLDVQLGFQVGVQRV